MKLLTAKEDEYLTVNDIVNEMNGKVASSTVNKYIRLGIIKGEKKFGKLLVKRSDFNTYLNNNNNHTEAETQKVTKQQPFHIYNDDIYNEVMANYRSK
ncbi:hypothetical protein ACFX5K_01175 [Rickettsiales bacterium LUAb2]